MTGRTNIIPTRTAAITSDEFDLKNVQWNAVVLDTSDNCVCTLYEKDTIVLLFSKGSVSWSYDGEKWNTKKLGNFVFQYIFYDGKQFLICGSSNDNGLIITTVDFESFTTYDKFTSSVQSQYNLNFCGGFYDGNAYRFIALETNISSISARYNVYTWQGETLDTLKAKKEILSQTGGQLNLKYSYNGKRCNVIICWINGSSANVASYKNYYSADGIDYVSAEITSIQSRELSYINIKSLDGIAYVFCNEKLYRSLSGTTWTLISEIESMRDITKINNQFFIIGTPNKGLITQGNESISEKTSNDLQILIDDVVVTNVIYALERVVMVCNGGIVCYASQKNADPETEAVKTMSARKALSDAKVYTDSKFEEMKKYIDDKLKGV